MIAAAWPIVCRPLGLLGTLRDPFRFLRGFAALRDFLFLGLHQPGLELGTNTSPTL